jgi:hypothetical protein
MSKGSNRRPQQEPDETVSANWARIFGKQETTPAEPESNDKGNDDEQ